MKVKRIKIRAIARHRNGICGEPFHAVLFDEDKRLHPDDQGRKVAIVFDEPDFCAVLDVAMLAAGDIAFGSNSWRGDEYELLLRRAIRQHQANEEA
jgi:hypothetical protein